MEKVKLSDLKKNGIPEGYSLQKDKLVPLDKYEAFDYGWELFEPSPINPAIPGAKIIEVDITQ